MLTNLHVSDLPESEKHNFGIVSVCEHDNSKTIKDTGMKFGMWSLNIICRFLSNVGQNPSTGSLSVRGHVNTITQKLEYLDGLNLVHSFIVMNVGPYQSLDQIRRRVDDL
ncbi:hypothetical protein AVEN_191527-1 [Araneus ventricosus]|uniref:Uncharacterized protein n=1 Tax=Araneus ventricosus TaxID=182803 RepID=A0A4Y2PH45_ARAVE|nr:hypothetical protein AVEN_191527-1 [Araneus ventricosus]